MSASRRNAQTKQFCNDSFVTENNPEEEFCDKMVINLSLSFNSVKFTGSLG